MPSSYTPSLRLTLPVTGELSGTWGNTVNSGITNLLDAAVAGTAAVTMTDADYTLTSVNGATDEARKMFVTLTGTLTAARNVICPSASKLYFIRNTTTGGFAVTLKTSAGTGISVPNGKSMVLYCNGTDVIDATNHYSSITIATALAATSGGTGQASYTTGDLLYASSSTALSKLGVGTAGQVLTSSGTAPQWTTISGVAVTTFSAGTTGFTPSSATSGAVTLAGTLATTNGGTGLTSFTANGVVYASSTSALTTGSALTFNGSTLATTGSLTVDGNATLGNASTDTVTVNGYMGVGGAPNASVAFRVGYTFSSGSSLYGVAGAPVGPASATSFLIGVSGAPATAAAAFTANNTIGLYAPDHTKGAGSTITNQHGVYINDQTQGTNNYGITSLVSSGANKWNIYASGTANNYFAGNVGIAETSPSTRLALRTPTSSGTETAVTLMRADGGTPFIIQRVSNDWRVGSTQNLYLGADFDNDSLPANSNIIFETEGTERMRLSAAGGLSIGTTTDPGAGGLITTGNVTLGDATTDNVTVNGYMGVGGAATASVSVYARSNALTGSSQGGFYADIVGSSAATAEISGFRSSIRTEAAAFTVADLSHFRAFNAVKGAGSTITNLHGLYIADQTQGTNNYGITSLVSSGTNKWNIYASGTAQNYFAGNVGIGTTSPSNSAKLDVAGSVISTAATLGSFNANNAGFDFIAASKIGRFYATSTDTTGGVMTFTTGQNGSYTERMRLDSSGNVGVGVVPDVSWWASMKSINLGRLGNGVFGATGDDEINIGANVINTGSGTYIYGATDTASLYRQVAAQHVWYYAASGTAGAALSLTEAMRINSSGNVGIGTSSPTNTLSVSGSANVTGNVTLGDASTDTVTVNGYMGVGGAGAASQAIRITNSALTGLSQYGVLSAITGSSAGTSDVAMFASLVGTAATSYTATNGIGFWVFDAVKGAGSTITNLYGMDIRDQTQGTNNYGISSRVSSGTNKWNIYASGTAANYFGGRVLLGDTDGSIYDTNAGSDVGGYYPAKITGGTGGISAGVVVGSGTNGTVGFYKGNTDGKDVVTSVVNGQTQVNTAGSEDGRLLFKVMRSGTLQDRLAFYEGEAVFNDPGNDYDFRVESDTNTHAIFLDAGNSRVGINNSSPTVALDITGDLKASGNTTLGDASTDTVTVNGYMGVGGAAGSNTGMYVRNSALTGVNQYGIGAYPTSTSAATTKIVAFGGGQTTAAAAFTVTDSIGFEAANIAKGAGSTITNQHGLYIQDQTQGTNNYGITSLVSSGANKWNIHASGTAANYFAGTVGVGTNDTAYQLHTRVDDATTNAVTRALAVSHTTTGAAANGIGSGIAFQQESTTGSLRIAAYIDSIFTDATDASLASALTFTTRSGGSLTERMRLDSSGNVGIGTSSPAALLHASKSYTTPTGGISASTVGIFSQNNTASASANVSILSRSSGSSVLQFGNEAIENVANIVSSGATPYLSFGVASSNTVAATERARIDSSGNFYVACTSVPNVGAGQTGFSVSSTEAVISLTTNVSNTVLYIRSDSGATKYPLSFWNGTTNSGSVSTTSSGTTAYNTSSDYRLKENIQPMTGALAKVAALKPVTYNWKVDGSAGEGFIAHELAEVCPQAVTGEKDAVNEDGSIKPQGIDTSFLVATLTAAIQEQQAIINQLKARLDAANL